MARTNKRISALEVNRMTNPGKHPSGDRLYLQITKNGTKSWLFRYSMNGKASWMGLGSVTILSLSEVRAKLIDLQKDILCGISPLQKKVELKKACQIQESKRITFDDCAKQFIDAHSPSWKHPKHISQWTASLAKYVSPVLGKYSVADSDTTLVLKILEPLWYCKAETASLVRARLERILSWASVRGYRSIENPARWRGYLDQLLPKRSSIQKVNHYNAMEYAKLPDFLRELRLQGGVSPYALEFLILTATRTNETLGAKWSEFNFTQYHWMIPRERMKAGREHRIPLSPRAIEILKLMQATACSDYVFPGSKNGFQLSNMALLNMIRGLGYESETFHGFRSTFADWANENTNFSREVIESCLAHLIENKVERAYNRSDLFAKRSQLMKAWSEFLTLAPNKSINIQLQT